MTGFLFHGLFHPCCCVTLDDAKITVIDAFMFIFTELLVLTALAPLGEWRSGRIIPFTPVNLGRLVGCGF